MSIYEKVFAVILITAFVVWLVSVAIDEEAE